MTPPFYMILYQVLGIILLNLLIYVFLIIDYFKTSV